jgi:hypothetical protein
MSGSGFATGVIHDEVVVLLLALLIGAPAPVAHARPLPDLAITRVNYDDDCRLRVRLENLGGALNSAMYRAGGVYLQRVEDGSKTARIPLLRVDTGTRLLRGQPTIHWTDNNPIRARHTVRYELTGIRAEANTGNNSGQAAVPVRCGGSGLAAPRPIPRMPRGIPLDKR